MTISRQSTHLDKHLAHYNAARSNHLGPEDEAQVLLVEKWTEETKVHDDCVLHAYMA